MTSGRPLTGWIERDGPDRPFGHIRLTTGRRCFVHKLDCTGAALPADGTPVVFELSPLDGRVRRLRVHEPSTRRRA